MTSTLADYYLLKPIPPNSKTMSGEGEGPTWKVKSQSVVILFNPAYKNT